MRSMTGPSIPSSIISAIALPYALLGEVAGKTVADANVSETAKVQKKIVHDCLTGRDVNVRTAGCHATWRFRSAIMTRIKPCKLRRTGRPLSLCLLANKANDSGAEACSAPEFGSRRVAKESIALRQIWADGRAATRSIALSSCPRALHHTEVTDGKVVRGIHRSGSDAKAQLHEPGDRQPFGTGFNRRPVDAGGADDVERPSIRGSFAPGPFEPAPQP
jgi:hypothetical protein